MPAIVHSGNADAAQGFSKKVFPEMRQLHSSQLHSKSWEPGMTDTRDIQHGINDPVSGVDVRRRVKDNATPHERAQWAADVRAEPSAEGAEEFLPEALRR